MTVAVASRSFAGATLHQLQRKDTMSDQMRPQMDWGQAASRFAAETGTQTVLCVTCVQEGSVTPPPQIVILAGYSYCLPHSNLVKIGPVA